MYTCDDCGEDCEIMYVKDTESCEFWGDTTPENVIYAQSVCCSYDFTEVE